MADEIVKFGSISASNFEKLNQIGELVQHSINVRFSLSDLEELGEIIQWQFLQFTKENMLARLP